MFEGESEGRIQIMIETDKNGLTYYQFENLSQFKFLRHGVFTRKGGVSCDTCKGLNIGFVPDDRDSNVLLNRELILENIGGEKIVSTKQVHGADVFCSDGTEFYNVESDAVITNRVNEVLLIKTADCQSVLLYDKKNHAIGNIHSGWRGSIKNIIGNTVNEMKIAFGTDPSDIIAGIGPSLGPCCSEFKNYKDEIPEDYWKYKVQDDHFDFWKISFDQLNEAGVYGKNIETCGICTKCNPELFYSYRYEKNTGRFGTVIMLKDRI